MDPVDFDGQLMVNRESYFEDVVIVRVIRTDNHLEADFCAGKAAWFSPDHENADSDGWLRNIEETTGTANFYYANAQGADHAEKILTEWEMENTKVEAAALLDTQATVFMNRAKSQYVVVKQGQQQLGN